MADLSIASISSVFIFEPNCSLSCFFSFFLYFSPFFFSFSFPLSFHPSFPLSLPFSLLSSWNLCSCIGIHGSIVEPNILVFSIRFPFLFYFIFSFFLFEPASSRTVLPTAQIPPTRASTVSGVGMKIYKVLSHRLFSLVSCLFSYSPHSTPCPEFAHFAFAFAFTFRVRVRLSLCCRAHDNTHRHGSAIWSVLGELRTGLVDCLFRHPISPPPISHLPPHC